MCVVSVEKARGSADRLHDAGLRGHGGRHREQGRPRHAALRARDAAHRPPERLHALRGQRRRASCRTWSTSTTCRGPNTTARATPIPIDPDPEPLHLHRPQQVHPVQPLRAGLRRDAEPGRVELRPPRLQEQAGGRAPIRLCSTRAAKAAASAWPTARSARSTTR